MKRLTVASLILLFALGTPAGAEKPPDPLDPVLVRIEGLASGVRTLESDFVQEKHLAVFQEVLLSRGRFYYAREDRLRWELLTPVQSGFVLNGESGRRWHSRTGESETFDLNSDPVMKIVAGQLLAWTRADFPALRREYRIVLLDEAPVRLRLEPTTGAAGFIDYLQIVFSTDGRHVQGVEIHEKDGDFTRIRFENTRVNTTLAKDLF
ncbi:outer membrane lipoprotein-sorting protein [Desulfuromonas soudanensis]|uniref:Outer membrane lipoprotein-sorting protein n=1 Tax=Desulfuromonas soudanensis TaxID=1603606 RepID=A0A0M4CVX7_9BACT|nr:outer membrane lipoprotein carrier protein LolA [Desulfuromonas soudanensis]ALC16004.1 outer membrane lipoprotein-sorting protein [Desulfuromonas soudanensis]